MGLFNKAKSERPPQAARGSYDDGPTAAARDGNGGGAATPDNTASATRTSVKSSLGGLFSSKKSDKAPGNGSGNRGDLRRRESLDGPATSAPPVRRATGNSIVVQDVIGRFCGLPEEDWNGILDLADILRTSEQASKDAAEAIRKEFKHGVPQAQERAARLLVVLMRNTTDRFKLQVANKRFLKQMQDTFQSSKTESRVKAMLFKAVAALAYESQLDADLQPISMLYTSIKPPEAPLEGIPTEEGDETFHPVTARQPRDSRRRQNGFDPKVQMEQLQQRVSVAKAEASMLTDSLAYTSPDDLGSSEIVQEFYAKVLSWQEFVVQELPWAQAEADKAHRVREENGSTAAGPAPEEVFLDSLLGAHGEIHDALAQYHRLEQQANRKAQEEADLLAATERSRQETRFNAQQNEPEDPFHLSAPTQPIASSSGSSRSATPEPMPQTQPVTAVSPERTPLKSRNPYARLSDGSGSIASPQITQGYLVDEPDEVPQLSPMRAASSNNPFLSASRNRKDSDEIPVPREPSAKALGKLRRVSGQPVDAEEQQKRLEEQLRQRYEDDYARSRPTAAVPSNGSTAGASSEPPSIQQLSILDEYDPYRA